jgi:hypothetical protein
MLKWVGVAAVILCAFAVGFVVVAFSLKKDEGEGAKAAAGQKQQTAADVTPAPTPPTAPASPTPPKATVAARVKIALVLTPANARVQLDGAPTRENPLILPRSDTSHVLTISAAGYEDEKRTVVARADQTVKVSLRKKARAVAAPGPVAKKPVAKKKTEKKPATKAEPAAVRPAAKKVKKKKKQGPRFDDLEQDSPRFDQL